MRKKATKQVLNAELVNDRGEDRLWLIRDQNRVVICFVSKFKPRDDYTDPFKVYRAIVGQGPVRCGDMAYVTYDARTPEQAAAATRCFLRKG